MSLILDALRKSDRQRNRKAAEQLRWAPGPARHHRDGPHAATVVLLLVAALGLVGASAWVGSWLAGSAQETAENDESASGNMENGESNVRLNRERQGMVRALQGELATPRAAGNATTGTPAPDIDRDPAEEAIAMATPLAEMPAAFRDRLPELVINVHAWTESPRERFVLINMRRYAEGERLDEGPVLLAITPDGVVLEYRGERFSLSQR